MPSHPVRSTTIIVTILLSVSALSVSAQIPPAWITISRQWSDGSVYLWNTASKQAVRIYERQNWDDPNPGHSTFSPDGKRVAFIVKKSGSNYGVMVVNNDGSNLQRVSATFSSSTGQGFCNICWTDRGLFWTENTRDIYWANPDTKESRVLGTIEANTTGNHLRMSRDGRRAYLRTNHDISPVGALFFETDAALSGIINERPFGTNMWDHGSVMLNDGSACLWVVWRCAEFGNPPGCAYHKMFAKIDFVNPSLFSTIIPNDGHGNGWELDGPGWGPYTAANSTDHILYNRYGTGDNDGHVFFIMNINTNEVVEVTPTEVAGGGPLAAFNPNFDVLGEFWFGELPNPHSTAPLITLDRSSILFTDQSIPVEPDTIRVSNGGAGTLSTISVAASTGTDWLSYTLLGSGNTQTIRVVATPGTLAAGTYLCTLSVSGGGAENSRSCVVTFSVGSQIVAPSSLTALHATGAIELAWVDNSSNETGFIVERMPAEGDFSLLAATAANVRAYRDTSALPGVAYSYRVRATDGSNHSTWSNVATAMVPLPPIVVSGPAQGAVVAGGEQIHILWESILVQTVTIEISYDAQESWEQITGTGGISQGSPGWGDYTWTLPDIEGDTAYAQIRIGEYPSGSQPGYSGVFTIVRGAAIRGADAAAQRPHSPLRITRQGRTLHIALPAQHGIISVGMYDAGGRRVALFEPAHDAASITWRPEALATRTLLLVVLQKGPSGSVTVLRTELLQLR